MALIENSDINEKEEVRDPKFAKGQSKRIWNELYKVIDSSDVIIQVGYIFNLQLKELFEQVYLQNPGGWGF